MTRMVSPFRRLFFSCCNWVRVPAPLNRTALDWKLAGPRVPRLGPGFPFFGFLLLALGLGLDFFGRFRFAGRRFLRLGTGHKNFKNLTETRVEISDRGVTQSQITLGPEISVLLEPSRNSIHFLTVFGNLRQTAETRPGTDKSPRNGSKTPKKGP